MKTLGLALGGGGARGCFHIGAIKALDEANITINYIAGTSIGAFIGGIYVAGDIHELENYLIKIKWRDVLKHFDPVLPRNGLFGGKKVMKLIKSLLHYDNFKKTKIPFIAVTTNLANGKEVHLSKGKISDAIRASIAIPGIITPFKKGKQYFVDGGVVNPLPINVVQKMGADIVIAIDLNHYFIREELNKRYKTPKGTLSKIFGSSWPNITNVLENSFFLMEDKLAEKNLEIYKADILVRPMLRPTSIFDFHHAKQLIDEGYEVTKKQILAIKKLLNT